MKKIILFFAILFTWTWGEVEYVSTTPAGTNRFRGMLTNNLGLVPSFVAYATNAGWALVASNSSNAIYAITAGTAGTAGTASVANYALFSLIASNASNSIWADGAGNAIMFGGEYPEFYTNLIHVGDAAALLTNGSREMAGTLVMGYNYISNALGINSINGPNVAYIDLLNGYPRIYGSGYSLIGEKTGLGIIAGSGVGYICSNGGQIKIGKTGSGNVAIGGGTVDVSSDLMSFTSSADIEIYTNVDMNTYGITNCTVITYPSTGTLVIGQISGPGSAGGIGMGSGDLDMFAGGNVFIATNGTPLISIGQYGGAGGINMSGGTVRISAGSGVEINTLPTASNHAARLWEVWQATNAIIPGDTGALLTNGSRAMASNLNMGGNSIEDAYNGYFTNEVIVGQSKAVRVGGSGTSVAELKGSSTSQMLLRGYSTNDTLEGTVRFKNGVTLEGAAVAPIVEANDTFEIGLYSNVTIYGSLNMNGGKISNIGVPSASNHAARLYDVQSGDSLALLTNGTRAMGGTLYMGGNLIHNIGVPTSSNQGARLWEVWQATNGLSPSGGSVSVYPLFLANETLNASGDDDYLYYSFWPGSKISAAKSGRQAGLQYATQSPWAAPFTGKIKSACLRVSKTSTGTSDAGPIVDCVFQVLEQRATSHYTNGTITFTWHTNQFPVGGFSQVDTWATIQTNNLSIQLSNCMLVGMKYIRGSGVTNQTRDITGVWITLEYEKD